MLSNVRLHTSLLFWRPLLSTRNSTGHMSSHFRRDRFPLATDTSSRYLGALSQVAASKRLCMGLAAHSIGRLQILRMNVSLQSYSST